MEEADGTSTDSFRARLVECKAVLYLRFLLLLACAWGATAAELEFSHELHLGKVGLSCNFCHSSVAQSAEASDQNLPQSQLCLACHDGQTAPSVDVSALAERKPAPRDFAFSHEQHLAYDNIAGKIAEAIDDGKYLGPVPDIREQLSSDGACAGCHRGLERAAKVDSDVHLPHMADCLVCHDQIDNPFSCEQCHAPEFQIKPDNHTREFVDQHSTGKMTAAQKLTCQPCHGRNFTCMGCH